MSQSSGRYADSKAKVQQGLELGILAVYLRQLRDDLEC
jgi:hypothetical protein